MSSADVIRSELEKILANRALKNAQSQQALLRYVVEQSLQGCGDDLKEYSIGVDVFHRKESFDPRRDNVVRATAHRLRWALSKYYEGEGIEDPVRIELPLGTYAPTFRTSAPPAVSTRIGKPTWVRWLVLFLLLFLTASAAYLAKFGWDRGAPSTPSVAVLPFRVLNSEKEQEFFADGLTQDLTDSLAQISGIRVVAPTSAFQYKGKVLDVRKVGQELNVGAILEGSVQRSENRLRITALLSDTASGFHIWSSSYDTEMKGALVIQREISDAITNALGVRLTGSKRPHPEQADAVLNPAAYQDYLKGRYFWAKQTLKSLETAIAYFEEAISKDPGYAPSYVGLAHCYTSIPIYTSTTSTDLIPKIRDAALKALALDSKLGEAHVDLARAYTYEYQWSMAEQEFRKALELSPGVAVVHQWYGVYLTKMGRFDEASAESRKALNLDPVSPNANTSVGRPLYAMRRYDEAIKQYMVSLEFEPNSATTHQALGIAYVMKGELAQGIAEMEFAHDLIKDNLWTIGQLGYAYAIVGKKAAAHEILNALLQQATHEPSPALTIAHIYLGLGNKDQAFEWLRKAIDQRNVNLSLKIDAIYDPLRSDPRFADLLRRMNLTM